MSEAVAKGGAFKWGHSYISVTFEGNKEIHQSENNTFQVGGRGRIYGRYTFSSIDNFREFVIGSEMERVLGRYTWEIRRHLGNFEFSTKRIERSESKRCSALFILAIYRERFSILGNTKSIVFFTSVVIQSKNLTWKRDILFTNMTVSKGVHKRESFAGVHK